MSTNSIPHVEDESLGSRGFQPGYVNLASIPIDLRDRDQWAAWRFGEQQKTGRHGKPPINPRTGAYALPNDPTTWVSFEEARDAYLKGGYDGIGYILSPDDPFIAIDLDDCRNVETGALSAEALEITAWFDSYTEISPSGTGTHTFIRALPHGATTRKKARREVKVANCFMTVTGQRLPSTLPTIETRQEVFDAWYRTTFADHSEPDPIRRAAAADTHSTLSDEEIIERASQAKNAAKFTQLWEGDWSDYPSQSEADQALVALLAFYTKDSEQLDRLFRQSELMRPKWDQRRGVTTYGEWTITRALEVVVDEYQPKNRGERRVTRVYDWQQRIEDPGWREVYLQQQANDARDIAERHIASQADAPLVIALAPGVGKTTTIAPLGETHDLAWIAQRHDMYGNVANHASYRHVEPAKEKNCPQAHLLNRLASMGHNVFPMHRLHDCDYYRQHQQEGSAFYQVAHVPTSFPKQHQAAIVDELALPSWFTDFTIKREEVERLREHERWLNPYYEAGGKLLRALSETMLEARQTRTTLHGAALLDTLDRQARGNLVAWIEQLERYPVMDDRPKVASETDIAIAERWGRVILPQIVRALREDLPKWRQGGAWNSRTHVDRNGTLHIIHPLRFQSNDEPFPVVILDATADEQVLSLLFGLPVRVVRQNVTPPPNMRHVAVRVQKTDGNVKRYGKVSLVNAKHAVQARDRVIREARYIVARENPDDTRTVGIISYQGIVDEIGAALRIPEERRGHFWAVRGSNAFEDCDILLVLGTPIPPLDQVVLWARALYADDPNPIDETQENGRYRDARLATLVDYLVNSELTQVAHRNRPMRHDGRVVVTLTAGEVDYLPITDEITAFPNLAGERQAARKEATTREQEERLEQAYQALLARGERISVRALAREAKVRHEVAAEWKRRRGL